tara:strand:- start:4948 stop:5256 length:309 start_codon:yes stop_codon:yes gene_type:complete
MKYLLIATLFFSCHKKDYGLEPEPKECNRYEYKHPVIKQIKPFHPNIDNDIKIRRFIVNGGCYYGELDGYGRTPFAYGGIANNPKDQETIKKLIREVLNEKR